MLHLASLSCPSLYALMRLSSLIIFSIPSIPTASAGGSLIGDKIASIQCVRASIPAPAVRTGGKPKVSSGSQIAAFGIKYGLA